MRLIKEMVRAVLKLLFHVDTESPTVELLENRLYDLIRVNDMNSLEPALLFYSYLNDKTDEFLEAHDFNRLEIKSCLEHVTDLFGLSSMAQTFLTNLTD